MIGSSGNPRILVALLTLLAGGLAAGVVLSTRAMRQPVTTPAEGLGAAPVFILTDQDGATFRSSALAGQVWIADFFFTRCGSICPRLTREMLRVQEALSGESGYRLVSITVDPEHDTPEVLRAYGADHGADPEVWSFLTGDKTYVHDLVRKGFLSPVSEEGGTPEMPILHTSRFALVGRDGRFHGFYDAFDEEQMEMLIREALRLVRRPAA